MAVEYYFAAVIRVAGKIFKTGVEVERPSGLCRDIILFRFRSGEPAVKFNFSTITSFFPNIPAVKRLIIQKTGCRNCLKRFTVFYYLGTDNLPGCIQEKIWVSFAIKEMIGDSRSNNLISFNNCRMLTL